MSEKAIVRRRGKRSLSRNDASLRDPSRFSEQCRGKSRFPSKRAAAGVSRVISDEQRGDVHPYRCPACRYWHVGRGYAPRKS